MREITHPNPVWRDKSNFIIGVPIDADETNYESEQLWAKQLSSYTFEVCCIPFFTYDLALGDVVRTDTNYNVVEVVSKSGHYTFRVHFSRADQSRRDGLIKNLEDLGALLEWSSANYLAVDAEGVQRGQEVNDYLEKEFVRGLNFERGFSTES